MAVPNILVDTTFTGKDITTAISVYEYTVLVTGTLRIQVRLAAVAGGGDYYAHLTLNDGDAQTDDPMLPKTKLEAAAGEMSFWFASMSIDVIAGDVINVFVKGLAGDTNEAGSVRIFSDAALQPTTAGRTLDVTATGAAGIDWGNVENPTTEVGLSGTTVKSAMDVETDTQNIQGRLPAALVSGRIDASVGAVAAGADPLLNTVPGSYASGTAGAALGRIGSGQIDTTSIVAQSGEVTTVQGDDYDADEGRAIDWTDTDVEWPTLTGATIKVIIDKIEEYTGIVVTATGTGKKVRLELTAAQTALIAEGSHVFQVIATLQTTDRKITLVEGYWISLRRFTE